MSPGPPKGRFGADGGGGGGGAPGPPGGGGAPGGGGGGGAPAFGGGGGAGGGGPSGFFAGGGFFAPSPSFFVFTLNLLSSSSGISGKGFIFFGPSPPNFGIERPGGGGGGGRPWAWKDSTLASYSACAASYAMSLSMIFYQFFL